jgi:hypothetical protein
MPRTKKKKKSHKNRPTDELRSEYDLSQLKGGVRGKYFSQPTQDNRDSVQLNTKADAAFFGLGIDVFKGFRWLRRLFGKQK